GPDQLGARSLGDDLDGGRDDRHRIDAGVGDASGKHRDTGGRTVSDGRRDQLDLGGGEQGCDIDFHTIFGELAYERRQRLARGGGDRDLDVDVLPPRGDDVRLAPYLIWIVGEDLEGDRVLGDPLQQASGELGVVGQPRLAHQRGGGGEPLDPRI